MIDEEYAYPPNHSSEVSHGSGGPARSPAFPVDIHTQQPETPHTAINWILREMPPDEQSDVRQNDCTGSAGFDSVHRQCSGGISE